MTRRLRSSAAKRLRDGEAHGMQLPLSSEMLMAASLDGLVRLATFLGIKSWMQHDDPVKQKRAIVYSIMRAEKLLAHCPKAMRWQHCTKSTSADLCKTTEASGIDRS